MHRGFEAIIIDARADAALSQRSMASSEYAGLTHKVLHERVAEHDEPADRHDQQPAGPHALRESGRNKIADGGCTHQSWYCRCPNRVHEFCVKALPIGAKTSQHRED